MTGLNQYSFCLQTSSKLHTFLPLKQQTQTATCCQVKTRKCQEKRREETFDFCAITSMKVVDSGREIREAELCPMDHH